MKTPDTDLAEFYGTEKSAGLFSRVADSILSSRAVEGVLEARRIASMQSGLQKHRAQAEQMNAMAAELEMLRMDQAGGLLRGTPVPRFLRPSMPFRDIPSGGVFDDSAGFQGGGMDSGGGYPSGVFPNLLPGQPYPAGPGMVRLASVAALAGADMAKEAGIGDFATMGKTMLSSMKGWLKPAAGAAAGAAGAVAKAAPAVEKTLVQKAMGPLGWKGNLAVGGLAVGGLYAGSKALKGATHVMGTEAEGPPTYGPGGHGYQLPMGVNQYGQPQVGTPL